VQADDVAIKFIQVSAGQWHTCALSEDGIISCWGPMTARANDTAGRRPLQAGRRSLVALLRAHKGWQHPVLGEENGGRVSDVPAGTFTQISVADWHGCGLRTDGTVDCWG